MARELRNLAASVHARLLRVARSQGEELQRLLVLFVTERFLYRLGRSRFADQFVLKGAMLFRVWEGGLPRTTRDLDLLGLGKNSVENILVTVGEIWQLEGVDDGLELDQRGLHAEPIRERTNHVGIRVKCRLFLGNASISLQIDVGFGDVSFGAERIEYPTLLDFPAPRILAYPKETVVAEKTQAMIELGLLNSRLKDYFDLCHLARTQTFTGTTLQKAMKGTFNQRGTRIPRDSIESLGPIFFDDLAKQTQWASFQRRMRLEPEGLSVVVETVRAFVEPVVLALGQDRPFAFDWSPGGPWRSAP